MSGGRPSTARVVAQAKVNLLLRVLGREAAGYHSIETIFQRLELGDVVTVRVGAGGRSLDCAGPAMPPDGLGPTERNLAWRAAVAYAEATGWPRGFEIEVEKRIPTGGGLGGGSADAGAVLRALDALSPAPLGARILELAAQLGADVPFMACDAPLALAWGRGERMLALPPLASRPVVLATPSFGISTADAYGWVAASRGPYLPAGTMLLPSALATWEGMAGVATNDFEPVVGVRHPEIPALVEVMRRAGATIAMMSGSGSTVFGVFDAPTGIEAPATLATTRSAERVAGVELGT